MQGLTSHLEDIGREMKRSGVIVQPVPNSDELLLDVPRLQREKVLFSAVIEKLPPVTSPEQLFFPLGHTEWPRLDRRFRENAAHAGRR